MGSASASTNGFVSRFLKPITEDRVGMRLGPTIGQHLFQTRIIRVHAQQKFADVSPRLDPMTLCAGKNRVQHSCPRTCRVAA
jgi:hypothetical protein